MKKKILVIAGSVLLISIIILALVFSNTGSVAAKASKQLDLGQKYLLEGNYQKAIIAFEKAIQIDPKNVDARLGLADTYIALEKTDDAITVLKEAMVIDPERPEPYISLANIYISLKDYEKALEILAVGMKSSGDGRIAALIEELKPTPPKALMGSGEYTEPVTIAFEELSSQDEVYYTLDSTKPDKTSLRYEDPITITDNKTLRAITYRYNVIASDEATYEYEINIPSYGETIYEDEINISPHVVEFKDDAFEKAIRKAINKPEGEILNTDLLEVRDLVILGEEILVDGDGFYTHNGQLIESYGWYSDAAAGFHIDDHNYTTRGKIQSLDDIMLLPNLDYLEVLYQNKLVVSVMKDTYMLSTLRLIHNEISDISGLSTVTYLLNLDLSCNEISDISSLSNLTNLESLDLWGNKISDISSLSQLTNLESLNLNDNEISDISSLSNLTNLESLDLWGNKISDISSLSQLTNLEFFDLWGNKISDISSLSQLTNLKSLNLSDNEISDISSLSNLTNLESLDLWGNKISDISSLSQLTNLKQLRLRGNKISDISSLSNLTNLEFLNLSDNEISDISSLSNLTNLESLDLWGNKISEEQISALKNDLPDCEINY